MSQEQGMFVIFIIALLLGLICGGVTVNREWQNIVIKKGYAEVIVDEDGRHFEWKDLKNIKEK